MLGWTVPHCKLCFEYVVTLAGNIFLLGGFVSQINRFEKSTYDGMSNFLLDTLFVSQNSKTARHKPDKTGNKYQLLKKSYQGTYINPTILQSIQTFY